MPDILDRLGRKIGPGAGSGGGFRPSFHLLVDRLDPRLVALQNREMVDPTAVSWRASAARALWYTASRISGLGSASPEIERLRIEA